MACDSSKLCLTDSSQLVFSWGNPRGFESPSCQDSFAGIVFLFTALMLCLGYILFSSICLEDRHVLV
jgi:hypothetical protein